MRWTEKDIPDQSGKVAIVTGSNSGLGFETAKMLACHGAEVVLACRSKEKGEAAAANILIEYPSSKVCFIPLDLANLVSVKEFVDRFLKTYPKLDLLVNNAGVMIPPETRTEQGFELQFGVNHLGHFALTGLLSGIISRTVGARVVSVASIAHRTGRIDFDDLNFQKRTYAPWTAYGQSKLANLLFMLELQNQFVLNKVEAIAVAAHPGYTATELQRTMFMSSLFNPLFGMKPAQGALSTLRAATDPAVKGGEYYGPHRFMEWEGFPELASRTAAAQNEKDAQRLWQVSEEFTGVEFEFA